MANRWREKNPSKIIKTYRCLWRSCGYVFVASAINAHQDTRIQSAFTLHHPTCSAQTKPIQMPYSDRVYSLQYIELTVVARHGDDLCTICIFHSPKLMSVYVAQSVCHSIGVLGLFTVVQHSTSHTYVTCINTGIVLNFHIILVFTFTRFTSFSLYCA